jgi:uncharacterized protein (TIGR00251 family)
VIPVEVQDRLRRERRLDLALKVIPKSSKNQIVGVLEDGSLKVKITAAPEKGKANAAVCELLAAAFGVGRKNVTITRGETSRNKHVSIVI